MVDSQEPLAGNPGLFFRAKRTAAGWSTPSTSGKKVLMGANRRTWRAATRNCWFTRAGRVP